MEVRVYCSNMRGEILSWKAKIFDLMQEMDKRSLDTAKKSSTSINELSDMINELETKIDQLETECPANWDKERADVEQIISDMNRIWEESVEMSPDDF